MEQFHGKTYSSSVEPMLVKILGFAQSKIVVFMYTFTSKVIAGALRVASQRGVEVDVYVDQGMYAAKGMRKLMDELTAGSTVRLFECEPKQRGGQMHLKSLYVDGALRASGSYNYTMAAKTKNTESCTVRCGAVEVNESFQAEWTLLNETCELICKSVDHHRKRPRMDAVGDLPSFVLPLPIPHVDFQLVGMSDDMLIYRNLGDTYMFRDGQFTKLIRQKNTPDLLHHCCELLLKLDGNDVKVWQHGLANPPLVLKGHTAPVVGHLLWEGMLVTWDEKKIVLLWYNNLLYVKLGPISYEPCIIEDGKLHCGDSSGEKNQYEAMSNNTIERNTNRGYSGTLKLKSEIVRFSNWCGSKRHCPVKQIASLGDSNIFWRDCGACFMLGDEFSSLRCLTPRTKPPVVTVGGCLVKLEKGEWTVGSHLKFKDENGVGIHGSLLVKYGLDCVKVWSFPLTGPPLELKGHTEMVEGSEMWGGRLVTWDRNGVVLVWEGDQVVKRLEGVTGSVKNMEVVGEELICRDSNQVCVAWRGDVVRQLNATGCGKVWKWGDSYVALRGNLGEGSGTLVQWN
jgi:hypothetical protein